MPGLFCRRSFSDIERSWSDYSGLHVERALDVTLPSEYVPPFTEQRCPLTPTMVHDFIENGTYRYDPFEGSEMDRGFSGADELCDGIEELTSLMTPLEKDIKSIVDLLLSADCLKRIVCKIENIECRGGCVRRFVTKHLRSLGYNAAICNMKWHKSGTVPGGEYEYVDVLSDSAHAHTDRVVIDLDFRSQFEIARPTQHYMAALKLIPNIFVGVSEKLEQLLQIMSEAAKLSLKENAMHLPPWRTIEYMYAKWLTPCDRTLLNHIPRPDIKHVRYDINSVQSNRQCWEFLKRIKANHKADNERQNQKLHFPAFKSGALEFARKISSAC
ncbi:hypothetical protein O6H91_Y158700 [Diphasiastrum complanatum]|nr:hypothetical protein O6H91_Y158700 [Diphasiastrum complanatum]